MRYLGNKTRLVPFILDALRHFGIEPGVACDPFAGTASVSSALKEVGWRVHAGDVMAASYALQVARVELDAPPPTYASRIAVLGDLPGTVGFLSDHYTLAGAPGRRHGRMYFSEENGRRIDAIRARIESWEASGETDPLEGRLLVATLIEAADRVANTTGVYASFVKTLQPNARRDLDLRPIEPTRPANGTTGCTAFEGRAADRLGQIGTIDLVYLDPPYNARQYPGYYHIPELIARGWTPAPEIRGKTGLIPDDEVRSDWCRSGKAGDALDAVLEAADTTHILFSYNDEGLLSHEEIESRMRARGVDDSYELLARPYRRYRSDSDRPGRTYARDRVAEHLHYVRCR
ncbi:MAG: DNA adenine methylase [Gemmatimonadota bacterium]